MKKIILSIVLCLLMLAVSATAEKQCIYYFYGEDCDDCQEAFKSLALLQTNNPQLQIEQFEVYYNAENAQQMRNLFTAYGIAEESRGLPVVFTASTFFIGENSIKMLLPEHLRNNAEETCPTAEQKGVIGLVGEKAPQHLLDTLTFGSVTGAGLLDSVNAGMLALLLLLLSLIILVKDPGKMLIRGFVFIGTIVVILFFFGLGWLGWFAQHGYYFSKIIGLGSLLFAIGIIAHFFGTWKEQQIYLDRIRGWFKPYLSYVSIVFVAAFATLWSLGRVEKPFLVIRTLMGDAATRWAVFPLLLYYLLMMMRVLGLVLLVAYLFKKFIIAKVEQRHKFDERRANLWKKHLLSVFNFVLAVGMVILGLVVLFL